MITGKMKQLNRLFSEDGGSKPEILQNIILFTVYHQKVYMLVMILINSISLINFKSSILLFLSILLYYYAVFNWIYTEITSVSSQAKKFAV